MSRVDVASLVLDESRWLVGVGLPGEHEECSRVGTDGFMEIAEPMKQDNKFLPHYGPTGSLRPPCRQKFSTEAGNRVVYTGKGFGG